MDVDGIYINFECIEEEIVFNCEFILEGFEM